MGLNIDGPEIELWNRYWPHDQWIGLNEGEEVWYANRSTQCSNETIDGYSIFLYRLLYSKSHVFCLTKTLLTWIMCNNKGNAYVQQIF